MDLNVIKQRLASLNTQQPQGGGGQKKNLFWKPSIGKQTVRIVPSKFNPEFPFTEMMFYYGIGQRVIASPANWKQKDPIMEFAKQLRQSSDRENWRLAKKLDPKTRIFAPVLVRDQEDEGVKLWQFGKEIYQTFLNMAADEEIGDYTDMLDGRDIKLTTVGPEVTGTPYNKTTATVSLKVSPIAEDKDEIQKYLNEQADPFKIFKQYSFDEIKGFLQSWLDPDSETESKVDTSKSSFPPPPPSDNNYSLDTDATKKTKADKFNDLFSDSTNDLPF
jgi:hypothetical protein